MSAQQQTAGTGTVVHISDRLRGRRVEQAARDAVQTTPAGVADVSAGTIRLGREGGKLEKIRDAMPREPLWLRAGRRTAAGARRTALGGAHALYTVWHYQAAGEYAEMIRDAQRELKECTDRRERAELAERIATLRQTRQTVAHTRHRERATIAGAVGAGGAVAALTLAATLWSAALTAPALLPLVVTLYVVGRREEAHRRPTLPAAPQRAELPAAGGEGGEEPTVPAFDAPPPPALSEEALTKALRDIGINGDIQVLAAPAWGTDGTATTVFDLPSGVTVSMLKEKEERFAGALGRDVSMIDLTKAGAAGRASLWMTDSDPFEEPRPSPLMHHHGGIDAWKDGVPVAWAKRGNAVYLPVRNSNSVVAGTTRSGKGVGAANLAVGASLDVRINLRIVAGKVNGEWDPYAKTGVAGTYFKPNPQRLLALLNALLADMDRRNRILGDLSKSKVTPETIARVGGIELLIIDELATYTRTGSCPERDDILNALIKLSAVAAGAGILMVLITQYPEVDVIPQALAINCGTRWAMRVDTAQQSNTILGGGASSSGRDASKFDPPRPGLGWLVNPFAGVTDKARSFDLDEDERGEVTLICERAAELRRAAGRLTRQWDDPIEQHLLNTTGLSSAAGGPRRDGQPGRAVIQLTDEQRQQLDAVQGALAAMDRLGRDAAQLPEMAELIGDGMTEKRLGDLLRAAGAGGTVKVTIDGKRINGYQRTDVEDAAKYLKGD